MTNLGWPWPLVAAPFVGSFMGVLIARLPSGRPVALGRSACPHCGTALRPWDMVPLASFLLLRGQCRYCGRAIGWFHPGVELAAIAVAACALLADPDRAWTGCGLGWTLLTLSWIDLRSFLLPDVLTLPLLLSGLIMSALDDPDGLTDHAVACVVGYGSFQALGFAYRRLRGRDGLGGGDAKLIGAAGAWCGLAALPFVIFLSAVTGLLAALGLALSGRAVTSTTRIPFGPCIALAFWLIWLSPLIGGP